MKTDTIEPQNQADHDLGTEIIRVLQLKRKRENGRVETTHGDKNPCGLARTVRQLSASNLERSAPELLAALQAMLFRAEIDATRFPPHEQNQRNVMLAQARAAIAKATQD